MATIYDEILRRRRDMTEWLIHFTRDSASLVARDVLVKILKEGLLRPGFAPRGGDNRHTVYGPQPAVCFSEQPLGAFIDYLTARPYTSAMAGYGILIHKHDVYAVGGLPVIYGLATTRELEPSDAGYDASRRLLPVDALPPHEQYRYVAFAPTRTRGGPLDWTHEREWRWPTSESRISACEGLSLGIEYSNLRGAFDARVHAFVRRDEDISWLRTEIGNAIAKGELGLPNNPAAEYHNIWWRDQQLKNVRIVSLETAERELANGNSDYYRFEDWPTKDRHALI